MKKHKVVKRIEPEFKGFFKAIASVIYDPQLTVRHIKRKIYKLFHIFDDVKIRDKAESILFSAKDKKFYKVSEKTGERIEIEMTEEQYNERVKLLKIKEVK